jgi:tetratricopeptide (TPR) repeat protein
VAVTTSERAGTGTTLDGGTPIEANDGSIARILGKRPVLWVGAGLSIAAGYPSTSALIDALVAAADDSIDRGRSFYEVVDAVVASVRAGRVRDVLQRLFQPARPPTPLHRALARLAKAGTFAAIITTNYDDLMERALAVEAAPFVLQPLEDNATVTGDGVRLLKIHGSYDDWARVVLSGRSYEQFEARNPFLGKQLDVLLRQQPVLFLGCSLQDPRILDWLAGLSPDELDGLKEWRAVFTGASWQTALVHSHRGVEANALFSPAGVRPLVVRDHDHIRALFVDAAAKLATPGQVVTLELEVTPTHLSAKLPGAPAWIPADLVADAQFMDALRLLRAWDHQPLAVGAEGDLVGPAVARATQIHGLAVQIGQRLSADFLSPAALEQLRRAIGASQASVPPLLHVQVRASDEAAAQHRGDQILALPWELIIVEGQFPVERGKLDVAREVVKLGARGLAPPERPLSVVAAVAAPRDASRLDYESECYQLWMAMGAEEKRLHITDDGQLETLARAMDHLRPQVLHFTGHGEPNALLFEDEEARVHRVPVRVLIDRLRLSGLPRLTFLASCHGATLPRSANTGQTADTRDVSITEAGAADADAASRLVNLALTAGHDPAWSSAAELHREGVDQVVAWFGPVGDRQCTRAERVFYAALVAGKTARQAVREARQESRKPLRAQADGPEEVVYPLGWAQLALYHRGDDVPTALPTSAAPAPARERARVTHRLGPTRQGVPGIEQLRFGFVGRRSTRAQVLQRVRDGQRLLVISGLGGLGKTALATTMAPIVARRIGARPASGALDAPLIIALDGRSAGRAADPLRDLWDQVARGMKDGRPGDAQWAASCDGVLADAQKNGLSGGALASVIAWWAVQAASAVIYLDDAESVLEPVAGAAELGRWRSRDLHDLWDGLCALAVAGGPTAVLVSTRYLPQGLPPKAALPLPPLARIDLVHLISWWPALGRLEPQAKSWVVDKLQGHPRSVEWLEAMLAQQLAAVTAPGAASGSDIGRETVAALFPPLVTRIDEDLVLPRLFTILGPAAQSFVQRVGVLSRPAPWTAVLVLEDEPGTAVQAQQAGLVSPFEGLGSESLWGALSMVLDKAGALTPDEQRLTHRRLGRWFRERWEREPAAADWAEPAAHHLLAAHEANAAWEPARRIVIRLRDAGRYREALAWVERVLDSGPSGAERGLALTFDAQLRVLAGDLSPGIEMQLQEALVLVRRGDRWIALYELGEFQRQSGRLADAARTLEVSVSDAIAVHQTEDHSSVATSLHQLAVVLEAQGDLPGAREYLERSLRIWAKVYGTEDHPSVAASLHVLAIVLQAQGDLPGARECIERSLRIKAKVHGTEDHPVVAASLHELARVLKAQGDLAGARERLERCLRIKTKMYGTEDHPEVATSLHTLAGVLKDQGDLAGARERLERSLRIRAKVHGTDDHPDVAASLQALAGVLQAQGDLPGARERLERSLRIRAKVHGTNDHPDVAASLQALAGVLHAQGDLAGARERLERSLRIDAKLYGTEDHRSVAASLHVLAIVLQAQGDLPGARECLERVLRIEEHIYGTRDHWSLAVTEEALAVLLMRQGDENDRPRVVQLFDHAYRTYKSQLGDDHPRTRALAQRFGKKP